MPINIKYTIIIPHFNNENGLQKLLASIPKRTDIQVLIIDDRSNSDRFKYIVNASGLPNIQYLVNNHEKSAGTCRNIGIENAIGDHLIFADSDDYFTTNAFSYIDDAIYKNKKAEIIFFKVTSKNYDDSVSQRHLKFCLLVDDFIEKKNIFTEKRLRLTYHVPWGKIIKRELIDSFNIKFDQTIVSNDVLFSLKTGQAAVILPQISSF